MTRRSLLVLGCSSLALVVPGLMWSPSAPSGELPAVAEPAPRAVVVAVSPLGQAGPQYTAQQFTGVVQPRRSSFLGAKSVGRVERILVDIGDTVAAGDFLLQLDCRALHAEREVLQARLAVAQAQLEELEQGPRSQDIEQAVAHRQEIQATLNLQKSNLARLQSLVNSAAISQQEYDEALFAVEATEAKLASATQALDLLREGTRAEQLLAGRASVQELQADLKRLEVLIDEQRICAPYAGQIQTRSIDEGAVVSPGQTLLEIVESSTLEIQVGLPPELAHNLQPEDLRVASGTASIDVTIARLAPAINAATRTRQVVLGVAPSSTHLVSIGSAVQVGVRQPILESETNQPNGFWVPTESLTVAARGLWAVYIAVPQADAVPRTGSHPSAHVVQRRQVELVRSQGEWSQVRGPLAPDELLVVSGVHRIAPGQRVECETAPKLEADE